MPEKGPYVAIFGQIWSNFELYMVNRQNDRTLSSSPSSIQQKYR